jgi:hypothetical protein
MGVAGDLGLEARRPCLALRTTVGWTLTAAATYAAVFVLPLRFPLRQQVLSDTWVAGGNNQAAAVALAVVSIAVTVSVGWAGQARTRPADSACEPLGRGCLAALLLLACAWTALLGHAVLRAQIAWGDEAYFLTQLRTGLHFHQPIYRGFEFAYGPALYLWPALWIRLLGTAGVGASAAYLVSLAVLQAAGLGLSFYTVQALPLGRGMKRAAFLLVSAGAFNALLGLNYTLFRFMLPLAAVVPLTRQKTALRAAAVAALAGFALPAMSPEVGVAFAVACMVCALYQAWRLGLRWLIVAPALLAGGASFAAVVGGDYLLTLDRMGHGAYNLLLLPSPYLLAYLVAVAALAPLAVARALHERRPDATLQLGLYAVTLGLLPAALGRCDPIHIFLDGMGAWLLALVVLDRLPQRARMAAVAALVCAFGLTQWQNRGLYGARMQLIAGRQPYDPTEGIDEASLLRAMGGEALAAPLLAPPLLLDDLTRRGLYVPGFYAGWTGVWDAAAEQRVIAAMRRAPLALVPFQDPNMPDAGRQREIALAMRLGLAHHAQRAAFERGALLAQELHSHWIPIGIYGGYILFRHRT